MCAPRRSPTGWRSRRGTPSLRRLPRTSCRPTTSSRASSTAPSCPRSRLQSPVLPRRTAWRAVRRRSALKRPREAVPRTVAVVAVVAADVRERADSERPELAEPLVRADENDGPASADARRVVAEPGPGRVEHGVRSVEGDAPERPAREADVRLVEADAVRGLHDDRRSGARE